MDLDGPVLAQGHPAPVHLDGRGLDGEPGPVSLIETTCVHLLRLCSPAVLLADGAAGF